jgi:hypothetical protein
MLGIEQLGGEFCIAQLGREFYTISAGSCSGRLLVSSTYAAFDVASFLLVEPAPLAPCGSCSK